MSEGTLISLDPRAGSGDLLPLFPKDTPVRLARLPWADAQFMGQGPEGEPVCVGVEIKKVPDMLKCIVDKRFVDLQLKGMLARYDVCYLIIEGGYRDGVKDGETRLEVEYRSPLGLRWGHVPNGTRFLRYAYIDRWLTTLEELAGVVVRRTRDREESAAMVASLYHWWGKKWRAHVGLKGTFHRTRRLVPRGR